MEVYAEERSQLFANAAAGFYRLILKEHVVPEGEDRREIKVTGQDEVELLKEFLSELNFLLASEQYVGWFINNLNITRDTVTASLRGRQYDGPNPAEFEIKAVTYHNLHITPDGNGWKATIIFDV